MSRLERGTTGRILLTSLLAAVLVLTPLTYALDAAGGHPARSAPPVLWVVWFVLLASVRLGWRRLRRNGR